MPVSAIKLLYLVVWTEPSQGYNLSITSPRGGDLKGVIGLNILTYNEFFKIIV